MFCKTQFGEKSLGQLLGINMSCSVIATAVFYLGFPFTTHEYNKFITTQFESGKKIRHYSTLKISQPIRLIG